MEKMIFYQSWNPGIIGVVAIFLFDLFFSNIRRIQQILFDLFQILYPKNIFFEFRFWVGYPTQNTDFCSFFTDLVEFLFATTFSRHFRVKYLKTKRSNNRNKI